MRSHLLSIGLLVTLLCGGWTGALGASCPHAHDATRAGHACCHAQHDAAPANAHTQAPPSAASAHRAATHAAPDHCHEPAATTDAVIRSAATATLRAPAGCDYCLERNGSERAALKARSVVFVNRQGAAHAPPVRRESAPLPLCARRALVSPPESPPPLSARRHLLHAVFLI